jgi:hypothetical protein
LQEIPLKISVRYGLAIGNLTRESYSCDNLSMELQTIAGSVRLANLKALIQKEDMARIQALTIDPAGALETGVKIGITSQEVDLKEDGMM